MSSSRSGDVLGAGEYGGQREWTGTGTNASGVGSSAGPPNTSHGTGSWVPAAGHEQPQGPFSCRTVLQAQHPPCNNGVAQHSSAVEQRLWPELVTATRGMGNGNSCCDKADDEAGIPLKTPRVEAAERVDVGTGQQGRSAIQRPLPLELARNPRGPPLGYCFALI